MENEYLCLNNMGCLQYEQRNFPMEKNRHLVFYYAHILLLFLTWKLNTLTRCYGITAGKLT